MKRSSSKKELIPGGVGAYYSKGYEQQKLNKRLESQPSQSSKGWKKIISSYKN